MERRFIILLAAVVIVSFVGSGAYDAANAEKTCKSGCTPADASYACKPYCQKNMFEKAFDATAKITLTNPSKQGAYGGLLKLVNAHKKKKKIKYICTSGSGAYAITIKSNKKINGYKCRKITSEW